MPRDLPWKVNKAKPAAAPHSRVVALPSRPSRSPAPAHSRRSTPGTPKPESSSTPSRLRSITHTSARSRSPSTSPPPEPLKEKFMIPGPQNDDKYRMVEDEFLSIAQEFTRHLHTAEYQRLKSLAMSKKAQSDADTTISNMISRPVTGEMTDMVRRHHAALNTASKQRKAIAKVIKSTKTAGNNVAWMHSDNEDDDEEPQINREPSSLQGLMDSPRKKVAPISLMSFSSGLGRSSSVASPTGKRKTEDAKQEIFGTDTDSDDLDSQMPWPSSKRNTNPIKVERLATQESSETVLLTRRPASQIKTESSLAQRPPPSRITTQIIPVKREQEEHDEEDEDEFFARIKARRTAQQRRLEQTKQEDTKIKSEREKKLHEIPFII
ncbi:hypothetical protein QBC35DRAFT_195747 [Podospora australis]|uniref:Uncharacterized protein n=1 Tax=Podospora australis TaxID=1536484 RepID=A0AAN7AJ10_9PEZI|nr:hypothetical protein QBC35DRAFT_195747 [Podospora australis]